LKFLAEAPPIFEYHLPDKPMCQQGVRVKRLVTTH